MILHSAAVAALGLCLAASTSLGALEPASGLEQGFTHPPAEARPWVYWFWIDGNVTREGISADLEAMQRVGIGGVLLMDVSQGLPRGPVEFNSPEWQSLFRHAVSEATRLGLKVCLHNSVGWTGSGGPWISPELAMQKLVTAGTNLIGPAVFSGRLPPFPLQDPGCRAVATIAYPAAGGDGGPLPGFPPKLVSISGRLADDGERLFDHDLATFVSVRAPEHHRSEYLQLEFANDYTAASLKLTGAWPTQKFRGTLQVSQNGREFRDVREFVSHSSGLSLNFEPTQARFFRLLFTSADVGLKELRFSELELEPAYRIAWYQSKSGAGPMPPNASSFIQHVPPQAIIDPAKVLDLTAQTDEAGTLRWQVPKGIWTVLRFGSAPIGTLTRGSLPEGTGLECDKLNPAAIRSHFDHFIGPLVAQTGTNSAFTATHIDSWEIGFQNWTPGFCAEFKKRRGYDPLPYLPAFSGRFVAGPQQSERFLWDVRRTIADLVADNYAGALAELAHQHGLTLSLEGYPSLGKAPFDELQYAGRADVPMAEFWFGTNDLSDFELRSMPSAAHTYGKRIVAAEAFTSEARFASWQADPSSLKPLADAAFCEGVNRLVIHRFAHQPWLDRAPGMTMGPFGIHYERTQTWWEQSRPWHEYLARCQYLLQQGLFVADVGYLTSESAFEPLPRKNQLKPAIPAGYHYDLISPEVVLNQMTVKGGRLVLSDGMSYQALVLADCPTMTPELLGKIGRLVAAGATVLGVRPTNSPSLAGYPRCDDQVKALGDELWGASPAREGTRKFGKGTVVCGKSLQEMFAEQNLAPDFITLGSLPGSTLHWTHRHSDTADIYFVSNSDSHGVVADCRFRISGKVPEIWHADTGQMEEAGVWREEQGGTRVRLHLDAWGSTFVIFRRSDSGRDPVVSVTRDGQPADSASVIAGAEGALSLLASQPGAYSAELASGKRLAARIQSVPSPMELTMPWHLTFPGQSSPPVHISFEQLASWTTRTNPAVKYFSGTATYQTAFNVPADFLNSSRDFILSLGKVRVIAEVALNGTSLGVLWKAPFEADVTRILKAGTNSLEIKVTNLWPNRLIGDEQLPEDCTWPRSVESDSGYPIAQWPQWLLQGKPSPTGRTTFTTWKHWHKDSPLLDSGLLGPVTLRTLERRPLR